MPAATVSASGDVGLMLKSKDETNRLPPSAAGITASTPGVPAGDIGLTVD